METSEMLEHMVFLAAVSVLAVLEQAYFSLQVIYARRKYSVAPPSTAGPDAFQRVFRAQVNCAEYFPIFLTSLWMAGLFFHQGLSSFCGLVYLYSRYQYFRGYSESAIGRLLPLYNSAKALWLLIGFSCLGILCSLSRIYLCLDPVLLIWNTTEDP